MQADRHRGVATHSHRPQFRHPGGAAAALAAMLLAGCVVGPYYHPPAAPTQHDYLASGPLKATAATQGADGAAQTFTAGQTLRRDWARLYHCPALDALIDEALANNPGTQATQARLDAARAAVNVVAGGRYPSVGVGANASRNRASGVAFGIEDPAFVNTFNLYQAQLSASYDLDLFGGLTRRIENKQALAEVARDRLLDAQATLVDNVVATALAEAGARTTLQAVQAIVAQQQKTLNLVQAQERYGTALKSEVLRAQAELADTQALLPDLEQQIAVARHRMAILTGHAPADYHGPKLTLDDFTLPTDLPLSLPSQLVTQRPDLLAARDLMHAAQARIGIAEAARFPQVTLTAGYGRVGLHPYSLIDPPAEIFDFGAALMAPLFEGGKLRAQQKEATDLYRAAADDYQSAVLRAFGQVADALRALQHDAQRLDARQRAREAAEQATRLTQARYTQGAADAVDNYLSQVQLRRAEIAYAKARLTRLVDTATLLRALGGGWWNPSSSATPTSANFSAHPIPAKQTTP